jgi:hypothetical protein
VIFESHSEWKTEILNGRVLFCDKEEEIWCKNGQTEQTNTTTKLNKHIPIASIKSVHTDHTSLTFYKLFG